MPAEELGEGGVGVEAGAVADIFEGGHGVAEFAGALLAVEVGEDYRFSGLPGRAARR